MTFSLIGSTRCWYSIEKMGISSMATRFDGLKRESEEEVSSRDYYCTATVEIMRRMQGREDESPVEKSWEESSQGFDSRIEESSCPKQEDKIARIKDGEDTVLFCTL